MLNRQREIYVLLSQLDLRCIRPLAEGDTARLAALNAEKAALRQELKALQDAAADVNE